MAGGWMEGDGRKDFKKEREERRADLKEAEALK